MIYRAFGIDLQSDFALPELISLTPEIQQGNPVIIERRQICGPDIPHPADRIVSISDDRSDFAWRGLARISIRGTDQIHYDPDPDIARDPVALALLGPVMAGLLQRRTVLTLHGSAVTAPGRSSVVFLGDSGAGKSTLAAACVASGWRMVSDDVVAVKTDHASAAPQLLPAYPTLKLSEEARLAFPALNGTWLPSSLSQTAKRRIRLEDVDVGFCHPAALGSLCVLVRSTECSITRLNPTEALAGLIRHSYPVKFGRSALRPRDQTMLFTQCAALVASTPVFRLAVPERLEALLAVPDWLQSSDMILNA